MLTFGPERQKDRTNRTEYKQSRSEETKMKKWQAAVIVGAAGTALTVTAVAAEAAEVQPAALVTWTV